VIRLPGLIAPASPNDDEETNVGIAIAAPLVLKKRRREKDSFYGITIVLFVKGIVVSIRVQDLLVPEPRKPVPATPS
jgi:hypothetical protein